MGSVGPDKSGLYKVLAHVHNARQTSFREIASHYLRSQEGRVVNDLYLLTREGLVTPSTPPLIMVGGKLTDADGIAVTYIRTGAGTRKLVEISRALAAAAPKKA